MSWLRLSTALFAALLSSQALAEDWKALSLQGGAQAYVHGDATNLRVGDVPPPAALLQTATESHLLLGRADDALSLSPLSEMRIEGDAGVRLFEGAMGVAERDAPGKRFLVVTADASFQPRGAEFGVYADTTGTMLSVREGLVEATDFATHATIEVRAGETFRALRGRPGTVQEVVGVEPATQAARDAERAAAAMGVLSSTDVDRAATGALGDGKADPLGDPKLDALKGKGDGKADAKSVEDAADALHDQRRKARLGRADPRTIAAVARVERELWQDFDVETEPWNDDFKWTEMEDGEIRLKPIWRIVYGLRGAECFEFWTMATLICLLLGGMTHSMLKDAGFGAFANALMVMTAFAAAILVRDLFFRSGANIGIEPFLSLGMMLGAMPLLLLSGAFAKQRIG